MKIKRQELINILVQRIRAAQEDRTRRHEQAVTDWQRAEMKYFHDTSDAWIEFAEKIKTTVERGTLLTRDDIPASIRSNYDALKFSAKKKPIEPTPTEQEQQLATLVEVLNQTSDEYVSTYSLEKMGFALGRVLK